MRPVSHESRTLPALIKNHLRDQIGLFLLLGPKTRRVQFHSAGLDSPMGDVKSRLVPPRDSDEEGARLLRILCASVGNFGSLSGGQGSTLFPQKNA
jgi:hypothetical protein